MIRLYQFRPALGLPNASPFCMKVELYLRMAGIPYENVWELDPRKGPKGKMPWIEEKGGSLSLTLTRVGGMDDEPTTVGTR